MAVDYNMNMPAWGRKNAHRVVRARQRFQKLMHCPDAEPGTAGSALTNNNNLDGAQPFIASVA